MPRSPSTAKRNKTRALRGRNSVRKRLSFSGRKRKSPDKTKGSWRSQTRKGQNLLARLEYLMETDRRSK